MDKFSNKYRTQTARFRNWDYSKPALYFITIVTKNRYPFFGNINNGLMCLNDLGTAAYHAWKKTVEIRPDMNITISDFVIMPDHMHGIIGIGHNVYNSGPHKANIFGSQENNLASIIRGYKGSVTTFARKSEILVKPKPLRHNRYDVRIIKDWKAYQKISQYIIDNPRNYINKKSF